jgi:hypothetical protein
MVVRAHATGLRAPHREEQAEVRRLQSEEGGRPRRGGRVAAPVSNAEQSERQEAGADQQHGEEHCGLRPRKQSEWTKEQCRRRRIDKGPREVRNGRVGRGPVEHRTRCRPEGAFEIDGELVLAPRRGQQPQRQDDGQNAAREELEGPADALAERLWLAQGRRATGSLGCTRPATDATEGPNDASASADPKTSSGASGHSVGANSITGQGQRSTGANHAAPSRGLSSAIATTRSAN